MSQTVDPVQRRLEILKNVRERQDLSLPPIPFLKKKYEHFDGSIRDFSLRYYQIQGVMHLLLSKRFVLGDDTGIGKTPQAISALCHLFNTDPNRRVLVVTTKSAVGQWIDEFARFTNGIQTFLVDGKKKDREEAIEAFEQVDSGARVLVTGYRALVQDFTFYHKLKPFDIVIYDEATAFKNDSTQVHQCCKYLSYQADRCWGLTATLINNDLTEAWAIYEVVRPGLFGKKTAFMSLFCIIQMIPIKRGSRKVPKIVGYHDEQLESFKEIISPYYLGRAKLEVATDLPVLTSRHINVPMNRKQSAKYMEALGGLLELGEGSDAVVKEVDKLTAIIYCQEIVNCLELLDVEGGSKKKDELMDLLTNSEFAGEKVIVYSRFERMVSILCEELRQKKITCGRITGKEKQPERKEWQKQFLDPNSGMNVIFITDAAAQGVNLQSAKALIFYDSPWSAGNYLQILGRMIRIGSLHDSVYAIHLVTSPKTIDGRVQQVLRKKMRLIEKVLGQRVKGLSTEDDLPEVDERNDISILFEGLLEDARTLRKK